MPTYTYVCDCGCRFVQSRGISEEVGWQYCPECHKRAKSLVTGGATTILVGTNWAGKQAKMEADTQRIMRDGPGVLQNKENWAEYD